MISFLKKIFKINYQSHLESFVASKNPQTIVEVEHWIQYYDSHIRKFGMY